MSEPLTRLLEAKEQDAKVSQQLGEQVDRKAWLLEKRT
jgi:hypothetical protein